MDGEWTGVRCLYGEAAAGAACPINGVHAEPNGPRKVSMAYL